MVKLVTFAAFLPLVLFPQLAAAAVADWNIAAINLTPDADTARGQLTVVVASTTSGQRVELSARFPLEKVYESFAVGNKVAVLGETRSAQAVLVFDIGQRRLADWFACYSPQRVSEEWIAFVEFYPAHADYDLGAPTDVVLVYDLSKSPLENRLEKRPGMTFPPDDTDSATVHVGIPIYPELNAQRKEYSNVVTDPADARRAIGAGGFVLLGADRLVFIASEGGAARDRRNWLVAIDLANGLERATSQRVEIPRNRLNKPGPLPNFTAVTRLEAVSATAVRLYVTRGDYGVDSVVVAIPR